jgi:hypothetical protein
MQAGPAPLPAGFSGEARACAYFSDVKDPLHLVLLEIERGKRLRVSSGGQHRTMFVWEGGIEGNGVPLDKGSSLIAEKGTTVEIVGVEPLSAILVFSAGRTPCDARPGGHLHLLPAAAVPRSDALGGASNLGGAMHANAACPGCEVWLHENAFFTGTDKRADSDAGVHSHTEDEIIFVTDGEIRLGARLFPRGTAVAISAETLYSFTAGPGGMRFVNFRAATPGDIRFANGVTMSETEYWADRLPVPRYVESRPA